MDLLASLRTFVRVSEALSFSAVAAERGTTQSAVSRQIAAVEEHYGTRLIHRTTRHLALTDDGRALLHRARAILDLVDSTHETMLARRNQTAGLVRMQVPNTLALWISDRLGPLLARHDALQLEIVPGDAHPQGDVNGFDLVLSAGEVAGQSMIGRRIGAVERVLVATPGYLARVGAPTDLADLPHAACITFGNPGGGRRRSWRFQGPDGTGTTVEIEGRVHVASGEIALHAVLQGVGLALLPWPLVATDVQAGRLVPLLQDWHPRPVELFAAYPSRRHLAARTRVVLDFLADQLKATFEATGALA